MGNTEVRLFGHASNKYIKAECCGLLYFYMWERALAVCVSLVTVDIFHRVSVLIDH